MREGDIPDGVGEDSEQRHQEARICVGGTAWLVYETGPNDFCFVQKNPIKYCVMVDIFKSSFWAS